MNTNLSNDLDLVTAVDLNNLGTVDKPVYHFVYGSQSYGSLYGVYARFKVTKSADGNEFSVSEVALNLFNYEGVVNIGFKEEEEPFYAYDPKGEDTRIYLGVRGASMVRERKVPLGKDEELIIKKGKFYKLTFCRILYPLLDFHTSQAINPDHDVKDTLKDPIPNSPLFDSEFHTRSGIDFYNNPLRLGMAGHDHLTLENLRNEVGIASPRCTQSVVNLFF